MAHPNMQSALNLLGALRDPTSHDHGLALQALNDAVRNGQQDFALLMLDVLCNDDVNVDLRQLSGLLVKNYCVDILTKSRDSGTLAEAFRQALLRGLSDPLEAIRRTAAIILGHMSRSCANSVWLPLVPVLTALISNTTSPTQDGDVHSRADGAVLAIQLLCEDAGSALIQDSSRCLNSLVPLLLDILEGPYQQHEQLRTSSLGSLLALCGYLEDEDLLASLEPLLRAMQRLLTALGAVANDPNPAARRLVCQILVQLLTANPTLLASCLADVCLFMQVALSDHDEGVAKEAAEFWIALLSNSDAFYLIPPHINTLVNTCVRRLRLGLEQLYEERDEVREQASGESRIRFYKGKLRQHSPGGGPEGGVEEDNSTKHTIRKRAAALLDRLSQLFGAEVAVAAVPLIRDLLGASHCSISGCIESSLSLAENISLDREMASLALGALSHGCMQHLSSELPSLLSALHSLLADIMPETRAVACWAIGRYVPWFASVYYSDDLTASNQAAIELRALIKGILRVMDDSNPAVQHAACTALGVTVKECPLEVLMSDAEEPLLLHLIFHIHTAFGTYGVKNVLLLLDLIGSLAEALGSELCSTEPFAEAPPGYPTCMSACTGVFLPHVLSLLNMGADLEDNDVTFTVAAECLLNLTIAFNEEPRSSQLDSSAAQILVSCTGVISRDLTKYLNEREAHLQQQKGSAVFVTSLQDFSEINHVSWDFPSLDNVQAALELLSGFVELVGKSRFRETLGHSDLDAHWSSLLEAMKASLKLQDECSCCQAAFSLLGELLNCVPELIIWERAEHFGPHIQDIMASVLDCVERFAAADEGEDEESFMMVFNNASWALGLLAVCGGVSPTGSPRTEHSASILQHYLNKLLFPLITALRKLSKVKGDMNAELALRNVTICILRLGLASPTVVAGVLPEALLRLLQALLDVEPEAEEHGEFGHAWTGLLNLLNAAPNSLLQSSRAVTAFLELCLAHTSTPLPQHQLQELSVAGVMPWMVAPSVIVSTQTLSHGIYSILQAIRAGLPGVYANSVDAQQALVLAAFE